MPSNGLGQAVRRWVEWWWGACCSRNDDPAREALDSVTAALDGDDIELPFTDRVDLYTRLLDPEPGGTAATGTPQLSFSNLLFHESVIAERLEPKKSGWSAGQPPSD